MSTRKIFYHDTDAGGIVYYANYLKYLEEARTEFLEKLGLGIKPFSDRGLFYAVRFCNVDYKSPARYGDIIESDASLFKVSAAQIVFNQRICNAVNERLLVTAQVGLVCLNKDFKPHPLPDDLKAKLVVT
ncbi:MAG: YbgC/FadM family acyl-CoA thioesterase [Candidatus Omnitrophota bacterium]